MLFWKCFRELIVDVGLSNRKNGNRCLRRRRQKSLHRITEESQEAERKRRAIN